MKNPKAYSYVRQAQGDSYRRQHQQARDYCATHNLKLDYKTIEDIGVNAFVIAPELDGAFWQMKERGNHSAHQAKT
ncbi:hypothetical protein M5G07_07700 [Serratia symbiotica]|nr:hypothetical protein [Serratia symbiotica]